jgi:dihydrofolate reductase
MVGPAGLIGWRAKGAGGQAFAERGEKPVRKIVVSEFLTLDGVMQAPGAPDEDRSGGFEHGGWQMPYLDDVAGKAIMDAFDATGGLLLGRVTYDIFAGYWPSPSAPEDEPITEIINSLPKYVVSSTLEEPLAWNNSHLVSGNVAKELAELKQESGKDLQVIGSGGLAQTLMENDLADEYRLMIHPIVLGTGKRLFRDGNPKTPLRLVESTVSSTGVLIATYAPER